MKLLLLAGNSIGNKEWIEEVAKTLFPHFDQTKIHYYRHWSTGDALIDIEHELSELTKTMGTLEDWVVFAKSVGTILILRGCFEHKIKPLKCIFTGTAISWAEMQEMDIKEWLRNYSIPTLFIQKTSDPAISFEQLKTLLHQTKSSTPKEIPGNNHDYDDLELLEAVVTHFVK